MARNRRDILTYSLVTLGWLAGRFVLAQTAEAMPTDVAGNFRFIYGNEHYRRDFYDFLVNVFHLYPEAELHKRILDTSAQFGSDREIYAQVQQQLSDLKPFLADLTYALPALKKQKQVMTDQTRALLPQNKTFDGYLELGSTGRYFEPLHETLPINGEKFFISDREPGYGPQDVIDRGQITKLGQWFGLNHYDTGIARHIPAGSIELATVYIGFHHCPTTLREQFIGSIRDTLRPSGFLILRDHDAHDEKMQRMVALAHDVFNMGTQETWQYNANELRNFYSLQTLNAIMQKFGFKTDGRKLQQQGDPTLNTLMVFTKA